MRPRVILAALLASLGLLANVHPRVALADQLPGREDREVRLDAARAFLDAARRAKTEGDAAELEKMLRAWASLAPADAGDLPELLQAEAARAQAWAKEEGTFRLFASRLEDRVSAGVDDPAGLLAHLEAWVEDGDVRHQLVRVDAERTDRWEYRLGADRSGAVIVVIEAVTKKLASPLPIARVRLVPQDTAPPNAPDPDKLLDTGGRHAAAPVIEERGLRWWWIAGGAIAVVLAGAAIYQETQF